MKRHQAHAIPIKAALWLAVLFTLSWSCPGLLIAEEPAKLAAVVGAAEGESTVLRDEAKDETPLAAGDVVNSWDTVNTRGGSKILLRWDNGLLTSLGAFSSLALTQGEPHGKPAPVIQVPEGIVRFAPRHEEERLPLYVVTTSTASIEPDLTDRAADFIVETYEPSTTVVTVIAGQVKIKSLRKADSGEAVVRACQTAYVEADKTAAEVLPGAPETLRKLVDESTIQGTIIANLDVCPRAIAKKEPPVETEVVVPAPQRVVVVPQPYWTGTYIEPWPFCDAWFDGITVGPCSRLSGRILVDMPFFGQVIIRVPAYGPWACDPVIITPFIRHWLYRHAWYWHRRWIDDWRLRRWEALGAIHVAQAMHDPRLWWSARRELDFLNARSRWGAQRVRDFEQRMHDFESHQRRVRWRIPAGVDLQRAVDESFRSSENVGTLRNVQQRLNEDTVLQNRLTRAAAQEATGLATRLGRERNPLNRFSMRSDLLSMRTQLARGSVPISGQQQELGTLVNRLRSTSDPAEQQQARLQLNRDLSRLASSRTTTLLNQERLASLKDSIPSNLTPAARSRFNRGITELERSVGARVRSEQEARQYTNLIDRAANERDPVRRRALVAPNRGRVQGIPEALELINRLPSATDAQNAQRALRNRLQRDSLRSLQNNGNQRSRQLELGRRNSQQSSVGTDARRRWHADRQRQITVRRQQQDRVSLPQASRSLRRQRSSTSASRSLPHMLQGSRQDSYNLGTVNRNRSDRIDQSTRRESRIQRGFRSLERTFRQPTPQRQFRQPQNSRRSFSQPRAQGRSNTTIRRHSVSRQSSGSSIGSRSRQSHTPSGGQVRHRRK